MSGSGHRLATRRRLTFVVCWHQPPGLLKSLPGLKAASSLGAGVNHLLADPDLPVRSAGGQTGRPETGRRSGCLSGRPGGPGLASAGSIRRASIRALLATVRAGTPARNRAARLRQHGQKSRPGVFPRWTFRSSACRRRPPDNDASPARFVDIQTLAGESDYLDLHLATYQRHGWHSGCQTICSNETGLRYSSMSAAASI